MRTLLRILGVMVLIAGVIGLFVGGFTILYGEIQAAESSDVGSGSAADLGEDARDTGVAIVGASFLVSGLGIAILLVGITLANRRSSGGTPPKTVAATRLPPRTDGH